MGCGAEEVHVGQGGHLLELEVHLAIFPPFSIPHVFLDLQMRLFAWLRRREAQTKRRENCKQQKLEMGNDAILKQTDRLQTKTYPCQGDTTTSKMAAAGGSLCGTNPETGCSYSIVGDTQTHFLTSNVSLEHKEGSETCTAQ